MAAILFTICEEEMSDFSTEILERTNVDMIDIHTRGLGRAGYYFVIIDEKWLKEWLETQNKNLSSDDKIQWVKNESIWKNFGTDIKLKMFKELQALVPQVYVGTIIEELEYELEQE